MRFPRLPLLDIVAILLALSAPVLYVLFFETSTGEPYRTTAEHGLLLITLPLGFVSVWLLERRATLQGRPPSPVWMRLLLGGAAGLLLAAALVVVNALALVQVRQVPATSIGAPAGSARGPAAVRMENGGIVRFTNAFCGVKNSKVNVLIGRGLLGIDRIVGCEIPFSPPEGTVPKRPVQIVPPPLPSIP
jgi:hypothetical protein